ncbi:MAG TPA: coproporphyrinogen dehydrogenase HemZ, partial [Clostridium sp.]|nr:coproporphyrinogen dehydrogenase HemZ [Clostridium sp.]
MYKVDKVIKVKLNNLDFRYDVFQMINLFYPFSDIEFVNENPHIEIKVDDEVINIKCNDKIKILKLDKEYKVKEELRKAVFKILSEETDKILPWGTLVGIRPSKKALELLGKGYSEEEII